MTSANENRPDAGIVNLERAKNASEIARNLIAVVAIVIGGFWAMWKFGSLNEVEIANRQAETMRVKAELLAEELNRHSSRLSMGIEAKTVSTVEGTCIFADVTIKNIGTKPVYLSSRWKEKLRDKDGEPIMKDGKPLLSEKELYHSPLAAYKIEFDEKTGEVNRQINNGAAVYQDRIEGHALTIPSEKGHAMTSSWMLIRVGEARRIPFVVRIKEPGVYLLAYRIKVGFKPEEQKIYFKWTGESQKAATWSARRYVSVGQVKPTVDTDSTTEDVPAKETEKELANP